MPEIQAPDLGLAIRELLGIGEANPLVTLSPEVVGVVKLADLTTTAPTGTRFAWEQHCLAAGAGTYAFAWLANTGSSDIVLEVVTADIQVEVTIYVYNPAAYAPGYAGAGIDGSPRLPSSPTGQDAAAGTIGTTLALIAKDNSLPYPVVLPSGYMLIARTTAENSAMHVSWMWRE